VAVVSPNGKLLYISPSIERMGYDSDDFFNHVGVLHPDDRPIASTSFQSALANPGRVVHAEFRIQHANGTWRWQDIAFTNLCTDPSVGGIVVNFHDVTERKTFEHQLEHAAYHDRLTGLSNRAGFMRKVEALARD
jgi:PAS domain S-box-containing protein